MLTLVSVPLLTVPSILDTTILLQQLYSTRRTNYTEHTKDTKDNMSNNSQSLLKVMRTNNIDVVDNKSVVSKEIKACKEKVNSRGDSGLIA